MGLEKVSGLIVGGEIPADKDVSNSDLLIFESRKSFAVGPVLFTYGRI